MLIQGQIGMAIDLPVEATILSKWPENEAPLVSVICITYNHEPFIETTLQGFLIQATGFPFEIWVHDDASSDRTPEIVHSYAERYPSIIKPIYQVENQFSQGKRIVPFLVERSKAKYIALCEGDDFWIDSHKLARQVDILESNSGIDLCWHNCAQLDSHTGTISVERRSRTPSGSVPVETVIENDGGFIHTASLLIRREAVAMMPDWFHRDAPISDYFYQIYSARRGGGICIDEIMAVYRKNHAGSWTKMTWLDTSKRMRFERAFLTCLCFAEADFYGRTASFSRLLYRHFALLGMFGIRARSLEIFNFAHRAVVARMGDLSFFEKLVVHLVFARPWLLWLK